MRVLSDAPIGRVGDIESYYQRSFGTGVLPVLRETRRDDADARLALACMFATKGTTCRCHRLAHNFANVSTASF
jgi:hypothetical protein